MLKLEKLHSTLFLQTLANLYISFVLVQIIITKPENYHINYLSYVNNSHYTSDYNSYQ